MKNEETIVTIAETTCGGKIYIYNCYDIWIAKWGTPDYYVPLSNNSITNNIINYDRYYFKNQYIVKLQENYYLKSMIKIHQYI